MIQEKYDIFISYSRKDTAIADKICAALDDAGITYFIDRQGIGGGFEFPAVLAENIVNSRIFLLLASKNSYESKFTRSEIIFAFNKKPKNAILPYIIDNSTLPMDLELVFAGINWRNLTDHPIDPILVDDLLKMLGRKRDKKVIEEVMVGGSVNVAKDVVKIKDQPPEQKPTKLEKKSVKVANEIAEQISQSTNREKYLLSLPDEDFVMFEKNGQYGYKLKSTGEIVIPLKYDWADDFSEGLARVRLNNKLGFVDKTGKEVIPLKYDGVISFSEGLALVRYKGKYGFIDKTGKEVIPLKYDEVDDFSEGLAKVKLNGKWGFVDKTGKEVIPLKYNDADSFSKGLAKVKLNGKYGFVDNTGREVIPLKYDDVHYFYTTYGYGLYLKVKLNNKYGLLDKKGKEVIPLKYEFISLTAYEGLVAVGLNGKYGFVETTGKEVVPLKYDNVTYFDEGLAAVKLNSKWGFIDKTGKEVIPFKYDDVDLTSFFRKVKLNDKWVFINKKGKCYILLSFLNRGVELCMKFEEKRFFKGGFALCGGVMLFIYTLVGFGLYPSNTANYICLFVSTIIISIGIVVSLINKN